MEPRMQYAKTSDGVSIAYWTLGTGPPVVYMPIPPFSHIQLEWEIPECRLWYERLAEKRTLIRYDGRGTGLSDRDVTDYSLPAQMLDVEAILDALGLKTCALFASSHSGPVAIAYAAGHPERVSQLILWCCVARGSDYYKSAQVEARLNLLKADWDLYTETTAHTLFGWSAGEPARRVAALIRESITQETLLAEVAETRQFDTTELLPSVSSRTLVLHRRQFPVFDISVARGLASRIPGARLVLLEGMSLAPYLEDTEAVASAIDEFLSEGEASASPDVPSGTAVILFADIVDSTALTERLGDAAFRDKARDLDTTLRTVIREHAGTPIEGKLLGDGVLAVFTSARQAIEAALACGRSGADAGLPLHLGLHAGDVIREEGNVYGGAVNIASRISGLSAPGEVLVSDTVRSLARTSAGVSFEDRGEHALKGVGEPVRVWAVGEHE